MVIHYIYHIPERNKIGVTVNLAARMRKHKWTGPYQVLEQHECEWIAGDREWELQDEHGYPRDKVHYAITIANNVRAQETMNRKGNRNLNNLTTEQRKSYASIGGLEASKKKRKLTFEQAQEVRAKYATGNYTQRGLAKEYGMTRVTIVRILKGITYLS